jgi:hypothetical protein
MRVAPRNSSAAPSFTISNASNACGARPISRARASFTNDSFTMRSCGAHDPSRCSITTSQSPLRNSSSTNLAPRAPLLKLSTHRTCARSSGAVVPPEVTTTMVSGAASPAMRRALHVARKRSPIRDARSNAARGT